MELPDKKLISDFNEAGLQIMRINSLLSSCHHFSNSGQFDQWNWKLDSVWRELASDASDIDNNENKKNYICYKDRIDNINKKLRSPRNSRPTIYALLDQKEILLRHLQQESGKGSKKRFADEDLMD